MSPQESNSFYTRGPMLKLEKIDADMGFMMDALGNPPGYPWSHTGECLQSAATW